MRHGVMYADAVTTVSPTYAREIRTPAAGFGLDADLRARGDAVVGILNGVDYSVWNPATDPFLPHNYDQHDLSGKALNKLALTDLLRLGGGAGSPLIGMVTRLTSQKGIDLVMQVLPALIETRELRFVALGSGDTRYERFFEDLQRALPRSRGVPCGYSEELAHFIEGAADIFLMPSYYEPCGLNQMYSLRYGTVPVVRNTGGLADSVQQYDPDSGEGHGDRVQRLRRRRSRLGARHRARMVRMARPLEPDHRERHAPGLLVAARSGRVRAALLEPAGRRTRLTARRAGRTREPLRSRLTLPSPAHG